MDSSRVDPLLNKIIFNKYKLERKLGEGSFGRIYSCVNINSNEKFAVKIENKKVNDNLLESEACVLGYLKGPGIPFVKSYGASGNNNLLVMELLGSSLEDIFHQQKCKFSLKTVCMLGLQMIERIEYVHNRHIVHRDIKPDNFVMGLDTNNTFLYIIDFGLSKKYRSSKTLQHYEKRQNKKLTGTARYASINALIGIEQSRRDDLEAIGYVLLYFLRGSLPWQGLKINKNEDRYKKIYEKKQGTSPDELCLGFPQELAEYVYYTRTLKYEQDPDYEYLKSLFTKVMKYKNYENDLNFDWCKRPNSPKTLSTVVPNNDPLNKDEFKLNEEVDKNKISLPVNNQLVTTTDGRKNTNVAFQTMQEIKEEDIDVKNGLKQITGTNIDQYSKSRVIEGVNKLDNQNTFKEIENLKIPESEAGYQKEKRKKANSKGCCFA